MRAAQVTRLAVALSLAAALDHGPSMAQRSTPVRRVAPVAPPAGTVRADDRASDAVEAEMRHVDFHIDSGIVLQIARLRGSLSASVAGAPATLDDKQSFSLTMHSAEIAIDMSSLAVLLNRHVFGYPGARLRKIRVRTEGNHLVQSGVLRKGIELPFRIRATVTAMPDGRIRLHPTSVRVLGVGVTNAMKFFGVSLNSLVKIPAGRGASIDANDFLLDPLAILPPPRIRGHLTGIAVGDGEIRQTFRAPGVNVTPLRAPAAGTPNYMYFRHGTLRFGKLTMTNADLLIVDADPGNTFDFSLDRYNDQLVAGYSKSTSALGLVVHMPDFRTLRRKAGLAADSTTAPVRP
ncbi:MAG TPA: hypothetical protein VF981_00515 [Gemmatimonadaceae bacterium]